MLLPACVLAASNLHLTVKSNIEIEPSPEFCVYNISTAYDGINAEYYPFEEGMTWADWFNSKYNTTDYTIFSGNIHNGRDALCMDITINTLIDDGRYLDSTLDAISTDWPVFDISYIFMWDGYPLIGNYHTYLTDPHNGYYYIVEQGRLFRIPV